MKIERLLTVTTISLSVLPYTDVLPIMVSYSLVTVNYSLLAAVVLLKNERLRVERLSFAALSIVWIVFGWHLIAAGPNVPTGEALRVPVFIWFSFTGVFLVPQLVPEEFVFKLVSRLATCLLLIGLPSVLVGSYEIAGLTITGHTTGVTNPLTGAPLYAVESLYRNPNPFSFLLAVGCLSALYEYVRERTTVSALMSIFCAVGVLTTQSRTLTVAMLSGLLLVAGMYRLSRDIYVFVSMTGILTIFLGTYVMFYLAAFSSYVQLLDLTGRVRLWNAAFEAVTTEPILGYGPRDTGEIINSLAPEIDQAKTPHNSFLRMFVTTGIVGGSTYLLFNIYVFLQQVRSYATVEDGVRISLLAVVLLPQLFESYSIFGVSFNSVFSSIVIGYAILGTLSTVETNVRQRQETTGDKWG